MFQVTQLAITKVVAMSLNFRNGKNIKKFQFSLSSVTLRIECRDLLFPSLILLKVEEMWIKGIMPNVLKLPRTLVVV